MMLLAVSAGVFGKDNLAILPFTGGADEDGETIAELFSFEPALTGVFNPIPRTSINRAIQREQGFQMTSGMTDPDTIAALGKQLGAQYVVSGSITALGNQKLLIIAILKIDDLRQAAGDIQTYRNIEEIQDKLPGMARNIADAVKNDPSRLPRLAVPPVELRGGAEPRAADALAQILAVHIIRSGKYQVYPRTASLDQIQQEYTHQLSGDTADEHLPDLGRGTNPELVLSVTARKLGNRNMFNAAVINLVSGVQESGQTVNYQDLNDGMKAMEALALALGGEGQRANELARNWNVSDAAAFARAVAEINADTQGGEYTIILSGSFPINPVVFSAKTARTITLKGEGGVRALSNGSNNSLFTIQPNVTLVLDSSITLEGNKKAARLVRVAGGALTMKAGSTLQGSAGGGVYVDGGSFIMSGGTITGNARDYTGGGVEIDGGGSFIISGGTITGNTADSFGGGVFVRDGSFTMSGGTITGNTADFGGGVWVDGGSFTMSGGTITGNAATDWGGGVFVYGGSFAMSGGTITGNTTDGNGGGVYVGGGSFAMSGGTITGNTADDDGGGVYINGVNYTNSNFVKRGGGTIEGNYAGVGKAVYYYSRNGNRWRNSPAGPEVNMDTRVSGRAGGWE
jgi:TolB-like protein